MYSNLCSSCRNWRDGPEFLPVAQYFAPVQLQETFLLIGGLLSADGTTNVDSSIMYDPDENEFVTVESRLQLARNKAAAVAVPAEFCLE